MSETKQHENVEEYEDTGKDDFNVGDQFKYHQHGDNAAFHPILYTWQLRASGSDERICVDEADVNVKLVGLTLPEYNLGYVRFDYPARMFGYPEICKPSDLSTYAYSYTRRIFDLDADVWIRCGEKGGL